MRRIYRACAAVLALLLLLSAAGLGESDSPVRGHVWRKGYQYVQLGTFPQTAEGERQPILWRVLSAQDGHALLFSEYVLFNNRVHPDHYKYAKARGDFSMTELHALLNGPLEEAKERAEERVEQGQDEAVGYIYAAKTAFLDDAFTPEERVLLLENGDFGRVFLLSSQDLHREKYGFYRNGDRQGTGTPYALSLGLFQYSDGTSPYWTRTQGKSKKGSVLCTKDDGSIGYIRTTVQNEGVRPAVLLDLTRAALVGTGTWEDPFRLSE